ncbi:MAG: hypothetical protein DRH04_09260 [Deltaproteobacteria bacterium]|nr:MAG: hypothetical protein DRH04_09260 [Deltaproteobacteria bacterium]
MEKEERGKKIEVCKLQEASSKFASLQEAGVQIFVEGKSEIVGKNRYALEESAELAIYTSPPGQSELRAILEKVKPEKVYIIGIDPPSFTPQTFLSHLAGLVKYTLAKKDGQTTISALAAVTAQREATIRLGLEWLAAGGQVKVVVEDDNITLSKPTEKTEKYAQAELFLAIKNLLIETAAYRKHFHVTEAEGLIF